MGCKEKDPWKSWGWTGTRLFEVQGRRETSGGTDHTYHGDRVREESREGEDPKGIYRQNREKDLTFGDSLSRLRVSKDEGVGTCVRPINCRLSI